MTVYYFEGSPIVAPLTIASNEPFFEQDTSSLKKQRVSQGAQRWELSFGIVTKDNEEDLFINMAANSVSAKTMIMPQLFSVDKKVTAVTTGTVTSTTPIGATTVPVTFLEGARIIPKASFIKFSNHSKIYTLTSQVTTNGASVSLSIFPELRVAVNNTVTVNHPGSTVKPILTYYQDISNTQGIRYEDGVLVQVDDLTIVEAL